MMQLDHIFNLRSFIHVFPNRQTAFDRSKVGVKILEDEHLWRRAKTAKDFRPNLLALLSVNNSIDFFSGR